VNLSDKTTQPNLQTAWRDRAALGEDAWQIALRALCVRRAYRYLERQGGDGPRLAAEFAEDLGGEMYLLMQLRLHDADDLTRKTMCATSARSRDMRTTADRITRVVHRTERQGRACIENPGIETEDSLSFMAEDETIRTSVDVVLCNDRLCQRFEVLLDAAGDLPKAISIAFTPLERELLAA
jgi:hypothetical protein